MGCDEGETQFWEDLEEDLGEIPRKENTIRIYEVGASNMADHLVDFAMSQSLVIVNNFLKKAERYRITYKSGDVESQIDYILCRILGESITSQHRPYKYTVQKYNTKE
ncbi:uncharacterized protein [Penaeus vannamei]|uniref:uncharacterized protein n=1 Tax=Penaeus vannamei TaxID=6689 RepID=UPI00387F4838